MEWKTEGGFLTKEFEFNNFLEVIDFVNKVAKVAEEMNHHPDLLIHSYKKLKIKLLTHSKNKITDKDHALAEKINEL
ncbi:MAG: 4a-hydroxytetrahydrobiopterin dehydratase [Nanoarchaeota archaeon]|nr:4a-hydroxytetrahydrobiopterin dehydratase [Nanoarchaeota archaeon]